jgi:hypothetical protein
MPPVKVDTRTRTTVKVQQYRVSSSKSPQYMFWTVPVDKYVFPNSTLANPVPGSSNGGIAILDTGTTLNYLPTSVARKFNQAFVPPATYDREQGLYFVKCTAKAPPFAVVMNGTSFEVDARDNVVVAGMDKDGKDICISGTQDGGPRTPDNIFIL